MASTRIFVKRFLLNFSDNDTAEINYDLEEINEEINNLPVEHENNKVDTVGDKPIYEGISDGYFVVAFEIKEKYTGIMPISGGSSDYPFK